VTRLAYTVAEAAQLIGCGVDLIRRWVRDGDLPRVPCTDAIFIPVAALEAFVAGDAMAPAGPGSSPRIPLGPSGRPTGTHDTEPGRAALIATKESTDD
jgi:excisionase family DNA binding protein